MKDYLISADEIANKYGIGKREASRLVSMVNADLAAAGKYVVKTRPPKAPYSLIKSKMNLE